MLYLITIIASIPAQFVFYNPALSNPDYIVGAGADTRVLWGGPLILAAGTVTLVGLNEQVSVWSAIAVAPILAWDLSLGIRLVVKGFKPSPITAGLVTAEANSLAYGACTREHVESSGSPLLCATGTWCPVTAGPA